MRSIFREIVSLQETGEEFAVATVISVRGSTPRGIGARMIVKKSGEVIGTIGGGKLENLVTAEARKALGEKSCRKLSFKLTEKEAHGIGALCGGTVEVFVETVTAEPALLIIGAGHIGVALAKLGKILGFRVIVTDDRKEFAARKRFPGADEIVVAKPEELLDKVRVGMNTFVALVPRSHELDLAYLDRLLGKEAAYIGMIGSRRKALILRNELREKGFGARKIAAIFSPIGLAIGAEGPEEIALSIMAEIVGVRRGALGTVRRSVRKVPV